VGAILTSQAGFVRLLGPKFQQNIGINKQSTCCFNYMTVFTLSNAILLWGIGTRWPMYHAIFRHKRIKWCWKYSFALSLCKMRIEQPNWFWISLKKFWNICG